jgi:ABC-type bacteriocin/lantibiotic exporter with double-glycine peptidase domain
MLLRITRTFVVLLWVCGLALAADPPGIWLDVPFVKQEKDGCGAASIAMVMQYWLRQQGRPADESADATQIQRVLYSSKAQGIYASDLERYFQQRRFRTFAFPGEWADLRRHLEKGRPLIVALKPASGSVPLHYVVVTGLEWEQGVVMVNDPAQRKLLKMDRSSFEREWVGAKKWTLLALPQPDAH